VIITGNVRPPINITEIKLYVDPPLQYEIIGVVEASSAIGFSAHSAQEAQDRAVNELKKQAAKIGANGIILIGIGNKNATAPVIIGGNVVYATQRKKTVEGQAIYVIKETRTPDESVPEALEWQ
jgi:hypothetical protein